MNAITAETIECEAEIKVGGNRNGTTNGHLA